MNPPVSLPITVNNARTVVVKLACAFGLMINFLPTCTIVLPAVVTEVVSSSRKLVTPAVFAAAAISAALVPVTALDVVRAAETAPSGATSKVATVSSDNTAVYPKVLFPPAKFKVAGVIVASCVNCH